MPTSQHLADVESDRLKRWAERVDGLIRSKGGSISAREFQRVLNVHFHDIEAAHYDALHSAMWDSLSPVFDQMAAEVQRVTDPNARWTLADVGCGTGLATELILRTPLRGQISALQMVDTSSEMVGRCQVRAAAWGVPATFIHGQIEKLPTASVDFLIACSVLHHIPNLSTFCREIERVLRPGGFFLHLQDSRPGAMSSPAFKERAARLAASRKAHRSRRKASPIRLTRGVFKRIRRLFGGRSNSDYLDEVNQNLIDAGLIKRPLTPREIWSITDLRVGDLPYAATDGVGIDELAAAMPASQCLSTRSYGYFGELSSLLPPEFAAEERRLTEVADSNGLFLAGLWLRRE